MPRMIASNSKIARKRACCGFRRNVAGAGLVLLAIIGCVMGEEVPSSGPATAPTTSVVVIPLWPETAPAAPWAMPPLPAAKTLDEGLTLTHMERGILKSVRDFDRQDLHKPLFILLRRAAALPRLDAEQLDTLDRPSYRNMLKRPERYRGEPIRMTVHVSAVYEYSPDSQLRPPATRWWPRDRTFWGLDCLKSSGKKAWDEPVVIYTHLDPTSILGKGKPADNCTLYDPWKNKIELAGVFYKVYEAQERGDKKTDAKHRRMYPVIVAWQIDKARKAPSPPAADSRMYIILLIVAMLVFLFMYFKRVTRRQRQAGGAKYQSIRDLSKIVPQPEVVGEPLSKDEQAGDAAEVDPDLKAAAEEYRKEKGLDDDANDRG